MLDVFRRKQTEPLGRVFGVDRFTNPLSYVERDIDQKFKDALRDGQYSVVVIYGTSKQGKSSLRRSVLPEPFCTFVSATNGMNQEMLYRNILNQVHAAGPLRFARGGTVSVGGGVAVKLPDWLSFLVIKGSRVVERHEDQNWEEIGIDLSDAGGVARQYAKMAGRRPIVIDNFHYFTPEMQRSFAIDIRAFENSGVKFVIMGTWKARNYLEMQNDDLTGTIRSLSIEPWSDEDLGRVIDQGLQNLRVSFSPTVRKTLIDKALGNVGLLQTALRELLMRENIDDRSAKNIALVDPRVVRDVYREISTNLVDTTIDKLKRISQIGEPWLTGKTRTYFILKAFIQDQESTKSDGVSLPRLYERTNKVVSSVAQDHSINENAFSTLVKRDLLTGQQSRIQTPIIACDLEGYSGLGRVSALDSWFLITLRHHRQRILDEF